MDERDLQIAEKDRRIAELERLLSQALEALKIALERISELERRLGLNSGNSSKPPSSDGFRKKPSPKSLRCAGQNPSGGQKGHPGHTLKQTENPDKLVVHEVEICTSCQKSLADIPVSKRIRRQVLDIPEPKIEVTEHQIEVKTCSCGCENAGVFPKGVTAPVQYGDRVSALTVYLSVQQLIPEDRLQEVFADVFGLKISTATIVTIQETFATRVLPQVEATLQELKLCDVKHLDETGLRIAGKTQWAHVISSEDATHYRVSQKRGDLLNGLQGTIVHDHWKPYFTLTELKHALCNAHHLRELKSLEEQEEAWAFKMSDLLRTISHHLSADSGLRPLPIFSPQYDEIVAEGLAFHASKYPFPKSKRGRQKRHPGHNLLLRFKNFKDAVLRCITDPNVPFTNNQAERDIRMMKVKQKISGSFRTLNGAQIFCTIRSFISTQKKLNLNLFNSIQLALA